MTDTPGSNTAADAPAGHNVIAVSFADDRNAYQALTALKELDSQKRVGVREAVVVVRGEDGQLVKKDRVESTSLIAAAESAERKAKHEARTELVRARHEHEKAAVQAKLDDLKTKLHHGRQTETHDADRAPATPAGAR